MPRINVKALRALCAGLLLLLTASPALATWTGANVPVAANPWNHCATAATCSITLNGSVPANSLIVLHFIAKGAASTSETLNGLDSAGDSFTTYLCKVGTGTNFAATAYAITTGLVSGNYVRMATGSTSVASELQITGSYFTGGVTSSPEDASVRNCAGSTTGTIHPTINSGTPSQANDVIVSTFGSYNNGFSWSESSSPAWSALFSASDTNCGMAGGYYVNTGTGGVSRNPTTNNAGYVMTVMGFKILGGVPNTNRLLFRPLP